MAANDSISTSAHCWLSYNGIRTKYLQYIEVVRMILSVKSNELDSFLEYSSAVLFNQILRIPPSLVSGIVIGFYENDFDQNDTQSRKYILVNNCKIRISQRRKCTMDDSLALDAFNSVRTIYTTSDNVLFLRTPFICSHYKAKLNESLINSFKPVVAEILETIKMAELNVSLIPILCMGLNSFKIIEELMLYKNMPRYVLISSYHPNFMLEMERKKQIHERKKEHYENLRHNALRIINDSVHVFLNLIN